MILGYILIGIVVCWVLFIYLSVGVFSVEEFTELKIPLMNYKIIRFLCLILYPIVWCIFLIYLIIRACVKVIKND